jgi:hypothetical protein
MDERKIKRARIEKTMEFVEIAWEISKKQSD